MANTVDGGAADTFAYDGAGRLITANVGGRSLSYDFGDATGCPMNNAGRNTNRRSVTDNAAATTYCYDGADRLVSSSDPAVGTPAYDAHGNTTTLGTQTLAYDGADRHVSTTDGATSVTYVRDATDRILERKVGGSTVARYGYAGPGDSPALVNHGLLLLAQQRTFPLTGGVLYAKGGPSGDRWSYPNIHGDVMALADAAGLKVGTTSTYDPFGKALTALPDNEAGDFDHGWLGQHQRPTEHEDSLATIEMGARPYVPSLGRFLEVDPVEGGSANSFAYVSGDPINTFDIHGLCQQMARPSVEERLDGTACPPAGFESEFGYSPQLVDTPAGKRYIKPTGECSRVTDRNRSFDFLQACQTHDYGYDLLRSKAIAGWGFTNRRRIDRLFRSDMRAACGSQYGSGYSRDRCNDLAQVYYWGVRAFGVGPK